MTPGAALLRYMALGGLTLLAACASPPAPPPAVEQDARMVPSPPASVSAESDPLGRSLMERALAAERSNRWAEAVLAWEALTLVYPDDAGAQGRLTAARAQVIDRATAQQNLADATLRRGDVDAAVQGYLEVLALDPSRTTAADALRQIERARTRRAQVGRFARSPAVGMADNTERGRSASNLREHASLLATQGDIDSAIQLLRESPLLRQDPGVRALLVDVYVRKAESTRAAQPAVARAAVDAALTLDPRHAAALALRQQLPQSRARANPPSTPAAQRAGSSR